MQIQQSKTTNLLTAVSAQEINQAMGSGNIGSDRMRATTSIMSEIGAPACGKGPRRVAFLL